MHLRRFEKLKPLRVAWHNPFYKAEGLEYQCKYTKTSFIIILNKYLSKFVKINTIAMRTQFITDNKGKKAN